MKTAAIRKPRELENIIIANQKGIFMPQDFIDGILYYGFQYRDKNYLVSANSVLGPDEQKAMGIEPRSKQTFLSNFPKHMIKGNLFWKQKCDTRGLLEEIISYIKKYIFFPDERYYAVVAAWAMMTYVFRIYKFFPYLHVNADKGSGKTTLMDVLCPVVFNGRSIVSATAAILFRIVENDQATLFLDESEGLGTGNNGTIQEILRSGFTKSGSVPRSDPNTYKTSFYSTYGPKMFASINSIDHVLNERIIRIPMIRKGKSDKKNIYIPELEEKFQVEIRNRLYLWGVKYSSRMFEYYKNSSNWVEKLKYDNPRITDLWSPLFNVAELIREDTKDDYYLKIFMEMAEENFQAKIAEDEAENLLLIMANCLYKMLQDGGEIRKDGDFYEYTTFQFFLKFREYYDNSTSKTAITQKLKMLGVTNKVNNINGKSTRCYVIDRNKIEEYCKRYTGSNS